MSNALKGHLVVDDAPFPGQGIIIDRGGLPVDARSTCWRLNEATGMPTLNWDLIEIWSKAILAACTAYFAELIKNSSTAEVVGNFRALALLRRSPCFQAADAEDGIIPYAAISETKERLGSGAYRTHYLRKWYSWCCDQGYPNFSAEVAFHLSELTIGGNAKGIAVSSLDPETGPLNDPETVALLNALRASRETGSLGPDERAALWLCVALGCNPMQFALLREEDFEKLPEPDGIGGVYVLRVPRHKKGHFTPRFEFKTRKLTAEIGAVVEELIAFNTARRLETGEVDARIGLPMFSRELSRDSRLEGPLHEYSLGMTSGEFTSLVQKASHKLGVVSPRTGEILRLTCRRFRYTFATRLVREGASQRLVAEILDHSDLQNVQVYFDLKSDIVASLDKATAMALGPIAQAFLGHIVKDEGEASRGDRPSSRIYERQTGALVAIGTCGSFSFCGLFAPIACYTCVKFQPWVEAPHQAVLDGLLADRKRREELGLDPRMLAIHDPTILAVADVVTQVKAIVPSEESHAD